MQKIVKKTFITGTDTNVGKTLLTALLLHHLRQKGVGALAMKPFCSGGRGDVELLQSLQKGELTDAEMNPFYFDQPVAPYAAKSKKKVRLPDVLKKITHCAKKCDHLLIEGAGGLLVPLGGNPSKNSRIERKNASWKAIDDSLQQRPLALPPLPEGEGRGEGEGNIRSPEYLRTTVSSLEARGPVFTVADVIAHLDCQTIVVAPNRLGTINHTLLTIKHLQFIRKSEISVVLMAQRVKDPSTTTNLSVLKRLLPGIRVSEVPFLGVRIASRKQILTKISTVETILEDLVNPIVKKK